LPRAGGALTHSAASICNLPRHCQPGLPDHLFRKSGFRRSRVAFVAAAAPFKVAWFPQSLDPARTRARATGMPPCVSPKQKEGARRLPLYCD